MPNIPVSPVKVYTVARNKAVDSEQLYDLIFLNAQFQPRFFLIGMIISTNMKMIFGFYAKLIISRNDSIYKCPAVLRWCCTAQSALTIRHKLIIKSIHTRNSLTREPIDNFMDE